jgi:hypothetical protein
MGRQSKMDNRKTLKIVESEQYGAFISCSDFDVFDELEDFVNENYEKPFSVKFLDEGAELYFQNKETPENLNQILENFLQK